MTSSLDRLAQRLAPGQQLGWHSHDAPYAAIVLSGGYAEAGDGGRRKVEAGQVVVHSPFSAHGDRIGARGAVVVNITLPVGLSLRLASGVVDDPEEVVRAAADDPAALAALVRAETAPHDDDLPDRLAAALGASQELGLADWAAMQGVSARSVTRAFAAAFGIAPAHYRWRVRARGAWRAIVTGDEPLAGIAHDWGFADQPHMTRAVRTLTGQSPMTWRRSLSD
ncbi:helix-turn-helix domain-containing protein [Sphingoaurantiacus capsulatus]|uniref:Helix-turn-helix domain-containing protein n=1 Tax=Sphingoaurantiacus capsulatus TaxID=1771310 RepID=A0ABV7X6Q9_9SPHN